MLPETSNVSITPAPIQTDGSKEKSVTQVFKASQERGEIETKSLVKHPVSKVKETPDVLKTPESKLVSSHPQTPEEECRQRKLNVQLCSDSNCPLPKLPKGASYEAVMRIKAAHTAHVAHVIKRKLVDEFNSEE